MSRLKLNSTIELNKALLLMCIFLPGCSMLRSDGGGDTNVIEYSLPMSEVELVVVEKSNSANPDPAPPAGVADAAKIVMGASPGQKQVPLPRPQPTPQPAVAGYDLYYRLTDVQDPLQHYRVSYSPSAFSDDKFSIGVGDNGLLNMLNASPTDRTPDFFKKVGELAVESAKAAAALGAVFPGEPAAGANIVLRLPVNPTNCINENPCSDEKAKVLEKYGYRISFESPIIKSEAGPKSETCTGICFRAKQGVRMTVEEKVSNTKEWLIRDVITMDIPNLSPVFNVDVTRSAGVQRALLATVQNGYLTKYDLTKNSEAMAVIEVPIDLAKDVAGILPSIIGIQTTRASDLMKLDKARQDLFSSQQAGLVQQKNAASSLQDQILVAQKKVIDDKAALQKSEAELQKLQPGQGQSSP